MLFGEASIASLPLLNMLPSAAAMPDAMLSIGSDLRWLRNAARNPLQAQSHCLCSAESLLGPD